MTLNQNNFSIEKPKPVEKAPAAPKKKGKKRESEEVVENAKEEEK